MEQKQREIVSVQVDGEEVDVLAARDLQDRVMEVLDTYEWNATDKLEQMFDSATEDADAVLCLDARTGLVVVLMSPADADPWDIELARLSAHERDVWSPDKTDMVAALNTLCVAPDDICSECETYEDVMERDLDDWNAQDLDDALRATWCDAVHVDDDITWERTLAAIGKLHGPTAADDAREFIA